MDLTRSLGALLLVVAANLAPWAAARRLGGHWGAPLDGGAMLRDGTRVLGDHKTWRGLVAAVLVCGALARLLGHSVILGIEFAALALAADAASSFVKRRLRLRPGVEIPGVDQLPEALVPLLVLSRQLGVGFLECVGIACAFLVLDLAAMRLRRASVRGG